MISVEDRLALLDMEARFDWEIDSGAKVRGYLVVFEREQTPTVVATGTYVHFYVREDGGWKVRRRELQIDPGWDKANG